MTRARGKDEDRPRKKGDKKRAEGASDGGKRAHNGNAVLNGKLAAKESHARRDGGLQRDSKNKSGRWSFFGLVNIWLVVALLIATLVLVGVYTGGDLSAENVMRVGWPRLKRNSEFLFNRTMEALGPAAENVIQVVAQGWIYAGPWVQKVQSTLALSVSSAYNLLAGALQTAGLSEDRIAKMREGVVHVLLLLVEKVGSLWEAALRAVNWERLLAGLQEVWAFMVDQFRVLNAELWRNEAITALWEDLRSLIAGSPTPSS